jgi:acetyl-CoA synthetase
MNVSGHRISTTEVESALVSHPSVAEAAVIGRADAQTGQAIAAFVTLRGGRRRRGAGQELRDHVAKMISPIAKPASLLFTTTCPRPGRARSCAGCSRTSPRTSSSATPPRWPTPPGAGSARVVAR